MKKLLLILLTLFMLVACTSNNSGNEEGEEKPQEEVKEPIGYYGPFYLKGKSNISLEELKDHKIGMVMYYSDEANNYILEDLKQYGVSEDNVFQYGNYTEIIDNINANNFDYYVVDGRLEGAINDFRQDYVADDYVVLKEYQIPYYEENEEIAQLKQHSLLHIPFAIMITGIDESVPPQTTSGVRTDVNILMVVNPEKRHILTISFPRDSYMRSSKMGYYDKMNGFIANGLDDTINSVGETLGIEIRHFVQASFSSFVDMINNLGGVWVHVPYDVYIDQDSHRNVKQPYEVDKGYTKLYGEWALALARNRKYAGLVGGDYGRIRNQALIVNEIIARVTQYPTLLDWIGMAWNYQNLVYTDFQEGDIRAFIELGKDFASEGYTIDNYFIYNEGGNVNGSFVGYMPEWTLDIAKGKIDLVFGGKVDENSPYLKEILTGYLSKGAGTSADGGYIGDEYDLRPVFGLENVDVDLELE